MSDRIKLLPEIVANQIAAGEVVNRPASVVKEMMENAIDAGARTVKVNFRDGGRELIQIVDDGCGMSAIDARMAFDRHATSKIQSVDDIYRLQTFGFRGEALASIAAVAQVELRTRQPEDQVGTQTEVNGGRFASQKPVTCPAGSQFFVRNLFYNVPARRRFLDKSTVSARQIKDEFRRVALCNPDVAFELYEHDVPQYTLGAATLAGRIVDLVGRHIKQNLLEVAADTSIARIEGYIGRPSAAKKNNRGEQFLFVNGRFFKSPYIASAVVKAYEKLIPDSCQPSYFIYLTVDPSRVDVNVHPQKTEVKFADEAAVWQIVHAAVRETLAKTGAVPMMDFDGEGAVEIPVLERGAIYGEPRAATNDSYNPFRDDYIDRSALRDVTLHDVASGGLRNVHSGGFEMPAEGDDFSIPSSMQHDAPTQHDESMRYDAQDDAYLEWIPSGSCVEQPLPHTGEAAVFSDFLQLGSAYIVALLGGRLVAIDVRRARERTLYEEYLAMTGNGSCPSQTLLFPQRVTLSDEEYSLLEEHAVEAAMAGFDLGFEGGGSVEVRALPADMPVEAADSLLFELLQTFATPLSVADARRERLAAAMARAAARPVGATACPMAREQAGALLARLAAANNFSYTPSGKAIMIEIAAEELRRMLS